MTDSSSSARDQILAAIDRGKVADAPPMRIAKASPRRSSVPLSAPELQKLFIAKMTANLGHFTLVKTAAEIPAAVAKIIASTNLSNQAELVLADCLSSESMIWQGTIHNPYRYGNPAKDSAVSVTRCHSAIAETGTLVMVSGADQATSLNFLPDIAIVIIRPEQIVGTMEEVFTLLRRTHPQSLPRTVNFISGASRTSDIEGRLLHGIHGPRQLHLIWIGQNAAV